MSEKPKGRRDARVEALRLVAIAGIAVFHTFQTWFDAAVAGTWPASPALLGTLGCVSLLGSFGNNVFFLISGYFLVPRAAAASRERGFWPSQLRATARRALVIAVSVALWAVVALAVDAWVAPVGNVGLDETGWLVGGLEFIWVYLAVVVVTPVIGWVWARVRRPRAVVCALVVAVFAVNAYIAFVSPGSSERGLLEWRKLMSAATYLVAYLVGGALAGARLRWGARALAASVAVSVVAELAAGLGSNLWLLRALSFKSTSALSFALATSSLAAVAPTGGATAPQGRVADAVCALTPSILGFYIVQSVFSTVWQPAAAALLGAASAYGELAFLASGVAFSLAFLAVVLLVDRLVRVRLLHALHLA